MGRTIETSSALTNMWRAVDDEGDAIKLDSDGLYKLIEPNPGDYVSPPVGSRAKLRLCGISETFQMPSFNDQERMEDKVRLEFLILNISGNNIGHMKGKRWSQMFTQRVSPRSALGKLFGKLTGQPVPINDPHFPFDGFITTEFVATIGATEKSGNPMVSDNAIETARTVLSPAVQAYFTGNGTAPKPEKELAGVAAGGDDEEFVGDEDL